MRKFYYLLITVFVLQNAFSQNSFQLCNTKIMTSFGGGLSDIHFINDKNILASLAGRLLISNDGGNNWKVLSPYTYNDIEFVDEKIGYAASFYSGSLYFTESGGDDWQRLIPIETGYVLNINRLSMYNSTVGFCSGQTISSNSLIHKTIDKGKTWTQIPSTFASLSSIYTLDENTIFVGRNKAIHKSVDSGKNWKATDLNSTISGEIIQIKFLKDKKTGFAITSTNFCKTTDAGDSWSNIALPVLSSSITSFFVSNDKNVFLLTKNELYLSTNNGSNWVKTKDFAKTISLSQVSVYQENIFVGGGNFNIGANDIFLNKSNDGGKNWIEIASETKSFLNTQNYKFKGIKSFMDRGFLMWAVVENNGPKQVANYFQSLNGSLWKEVKLNGIPDNLTPVYLKSEREKCIGIFTDGKTYFIYTIATAANIWVQEGQLPVRA